MPKTITARDRLYYTAGALAIVFAVALRLVSALAPALERNLTALARSEPVVRLLLAAELGPHRLAAEPTEGEPAPAEAAAFVPPAANPDTTVLSAVDASGPDDNLPEAAAALPEPEPETSPTPSPAEDAPPSPAASAGPLSAALTADAPALTFTDADLEAVGALRNATDYTPDLSALLHQTVTLQAGAANAAATVLIVHTHGTESYTAEAGDTFAETDPFHTLDPNHSVISLGETLAQTLQAAGVAVLHDTTLHDYPAYNESYTRTAQTLNARLAACTGPVLVVDLHRDSAQDSSGAWLGTAQALAGEDYAQLMLVVGTDAGGLENPGWQDNLAIALQVQALIQRTLPGICRPVNLRTERFNQQLAPTLLLEAGACGDTLTEARRSVVVFGQALAAWLLG